MTLTLYRRVIRLTCLSSKHLLVSLIVIYVTCENVLEYWRSILNVGTRVCRLYASRILYHFAVSVTWHSRRKSEFRPRVTRTGWSAKYCPRRPWTCPTSRNIIVPDDYWYDKLLSTSLKYLSCECLLDGAGHTIIWYNFRSGITFHPILHQEFRIQSEIEFEKLILMEAVVSYKMWKKLTVLNFAIAFLGVIWKIWDWCVSDAASIYSGSELHV